MLGIGNLVMSDDGFGVIVVQRLMEHYTFPPEVALLDGGTLGLDLLPKLEGVDRLVVIDAVETGAPPGTVIRLAGDEIPVAMATKLSPHQMGLKDLLTVASLLGHIPSDMILWGVQPRRLEMGMELSTEVESQVQTVVEKVLEDLKQWGVTVSPTNVGE